MPEVVVTEFMDEAAVRSLAVEHDVAYDETLHARPAELRRLAAGARALIVRSETKVDAALIAAAENLVVIGRLGVGLDNIDLDACRRRDIAVRPTQGTNDIPVAEYVIAGLIMLLRPAFHSTAAVLAGKWPRRQLIGHEIAGKSLGLIGFGGVARALAGRASALGLKVSAYDPFVPLDSLAWRDYPAVFSPLETLLADSDAISLHVPLTDETRGLVGAAALARMKRDAVLINAARGEVVDEAALAAALREGRLGGALLDVFIEEPLPAGNVFAGVPNLFLTPHIAGLTVESNVRMSAMIASEIREALKRP
jgi:(S)-sulfolactate dehydrogenase